MGNEILLERPDVDATEVELLFRLLEDINVKGNTHAEGERTNGDRKKKNYLKETTISRIIQNAHNINYCIQKQGKTPKRKRVKTYLSQR